MRRAYPLAELSFTAKKAVGCAFLFKSNTSNSISLLTNVSLVVHQQFPPNKLCRGFQQKLYHSSLGASFNLDEKLLMASSNRGVNDAQTLTVPSLSSSEGEEVVVGTSTTTTTTLTTSPLEVTKPTITTTTTLEFTKFKQWTSEQVCSLLCVSDEQGGASLTEDDVQPLYDANFKGTSIGNIIETINRHNVDVAIDRLKVNEDYKKVPQTIQEAVVYWVDNLLKLYHLWSRTEAKEQLILTGENEVKVLIDSVNNWINLIQQTIEVPLIDFTYLTLKYYGFEKLDAFEVKIEEYGNSWVYSTNENEEKYIFSNVETIKQVCDEFLKVKDSTVRGRPSIEVLGQVCTGKTSAARYILPRVLADTINEDRIKNNRPKLMMAPTFYVKFDGEENPITTLRNVLKPLRDVVDLRVTPNHDADVYNITDTFKNFTRDYPNVHLFIVLDEVQLLKSTDLTKILEFAKSREYTNVTFILTGSTQGPFIKVIEGAIKNGLSYQEGAITYSVPTDNTQDVINDTFQFHKKTPFTEDDLSFISCVFGGVNCATISQVIKIMEQGKDLQSAVQTVVKGIFDKFDKDIIPIFSGRRLSSEMQSLVLYGLFSDKAMKDPFYDEYIRHFVDREERLDSNGKPRYSYTFKDKLLPAYLQQRFTVDRTYTIK